MTKTSKPRAITFPAIKGTNVRRNAETGIEIHSQGRDGYAIYRTARDGSLDYRGSKPTLADAREVATYWAQDVREQVAMAYDEAAIEIYDGLQAIETMVANRADEYPALAVTYAAAWRSYEGGHIPAANERMMRVVDHLSGRKLFPSKAESEAALAEAKRRLSEGTRVELTLGDRYGMRGQIVGRYPFVAAEDGRVVVGVKLTRTGKYRTEYADTLRELVGRPRP